jgi:hypothetical protein
MTQWNGIEVGKLYKMTGRGCRGAPLLMVVSIEQVYFGKSPRGSQAIADVTMMVNGRLEVLEIRHITAINSSVFTGDRSLRWLGMGSKDWCGADRRRAWESGGSKVWPYKAVV